MKRAALAVLLMGCTHSDSYMVPLSTVGAVGNGTDVQLTFNPAQDYWPAWTQDGQGILYSFVDNGTTVRHRCLGLLPAAGGSRSWQLCDNRATQVDSVNSFTGYALSSTGRLLYAEAVASAAGTALTPATFTLWLADTAHPFQRAPALTFPVLVNGSPMGWLSEIAWTGDSTFTALAQDMTVTAEPRPQCPFTEDSVFAASGAIVTGTVSGGHAILRYVTGTTGATGYSAAENGASYIFTRRDDLHLYRIPVAGGTAAPAALVTNTGPTQLVGLTCRGSTCLVAADAIALVGPPAVCARSTTGAERVARRLTRHRDQSVAHVLNRDHGDASGFPGLRRRGHADRWKLWALAGIQGAQRWQPASVPGSDSMNCARALSYSNWSNLMSTQ